MAAGNTVTGSLADSLDTIVASARSRREYDGVVPQLVDRVDLKQGDGLDWKATEQPDRRARTTRKRATSSNTMPEGAAIPDG